MEAEKHISSVQNPEIRELITIKEKKKGRNSSGLFVLEGLREFGLARDAGYAFTKYFICPEILPAEQWQEYIDPAAGIPIRTVSKEVYDRIAYRGKTEGLIALAKSRSHSLEDLGSLPDNPLILIAEAPEKPGNLGGMLRTADAAGVDAVLVADMKGDLYNPNVIRSSVGCLFTLPIVTGDSKILIAYMEDNRIPIYAAALQDSIPYTDVDLTGPTAIVVGTESTGLTPIWREVAAERIRIPMDGAIDSMNVSVSAAILIFEAKRQRSSQ